MKIYLAALAEIAACKLRILARGIGSKAEPKDRRAATESLDKLAHQVFDARFDISGAVEARDAIKRQVAVLQQGTIAEADVMGWAASWDEWAQRLDEPKLQEH